MFTASATRSVPNEVHPWFVLPRDRMMSLRLRLAVLTALAALAVVALYGTGVYLVLSAHLDASTLGELRLVVLAGGVLALLPALGLAWVVAGRALVPVTRLTRAAESIGPDNFWGRLPVPRTDDEISRLATAFNASLDRIQTAYQPLEALHRQRRFVADASDELRAPLTVILNDAQTLLEHPEATPTQREECVVELLLEARRMARLTSDLLQLARTDTEGRLALADVDWDVLFSDAAEDAERICAPREVEADAPVLGTGRADRALLLRALRVLFDDVARHTPETTRVTFRASASEDTVELAVAGTSPGAAPDAPTRLFGSFFRADPARHDVGAALDPALARQVVERHGGTVQARSVDGGGFAIDIALPRWAALEKSEGQEG